MLSYQHSFHAGNHADVLKHLVLVAVLERLNLKTKPYFFLDTHAGEGVYNLNSQQALQNAEAKTGILQLNLGRELGDDENTSIKEESSLFDTYVNIVNKYIGDQQYPGSPMVASALLRRGDKAFAAELHPQAFESLQQNCRRAGIIAQHRDGYEILNAVLPPTPNRGAVLIDPPYEQMSEYEQVIDAVAKAVKRWPIGIYMIWYPLLSDTREDRKTTEIVSNPKSSLSEKMLSQLSGLNVKSVLNIQFCSVKPSEKVGMYGSGMCILNPPWQLDSDLQEIIETLQEKLPGDNNRLSKVEWLKTE
nr:23S rRNA (adenine(2030)-N(6))-methyltransferase RlmJ [uncultured Glaciecola sp.]